MKRILQIALPLVITAICGAIIYWIFANEEVPERRVFQAPTPSVVAKAVQPEDFQVTLRSQGTIRARTESSLIPEVRGRIVWVSENFQEGAFFEEDDVLLRVDGRDYQAELAVAESALAQAELTLLQEQARYDQAARDWERLNPGTEASSLTLREPQLRQARSAVDSAQARIDTAKLNVARTEVRAPYAGRVLTKSVDVGQFVSTGNELARIYAVDYAEVRLPLNASQVGYLNLPAVYRGSDPEFENGPKVVLRSKIGLDTMEWEGRIVRSEGAVDARTRQLFVVAQVIDPYGESESGRPPLKVGTFVEAEIEGRELHDVYVIPRKVFRESSYVLVVGEGDRLERRPLDVVWQNDENIIARSGLRPGDLLCLTDVPYALEGLPVVPRVDGQLDRALTGGPARSPNFVEQVLAATGDRLPADLKTELEQAAATRDRQKIMPAMQRVRQWAKDNGVELPAGPGGPRT